MCKAQTLSERKLMCWLYKSLLERIKKISFINVYINNISISSNGFETNKTTNARYVRISMISFYGITESIMHTDYPTFIRLC